MTIETFFVRSATIRHAPLVTDQYNNQIRDWDNASSITVKGWLGRLDERRDTDNRDAQVDQWVLRLPAGTAIESGDRVVIDGDTFEVDGRPHHAWRGPAGEHHVRAPLVAIEG